MEERTNYAAIVGFTVGIVGGIYLIARMASKKTYSSGQFFQPQAVADIAKQFPYTTENEFILAAWNYVANEIDYEPIGSDMDFNNDKIYCIDCYFPTESISRDKGNCIAKSSLMASLLANRINADRIQIVVGEYISSVTGGHAWVELWKDNNWYLIETTAPPGIPPFKVASTLYGSKYIPGVILESDRMKYATNDEVAKLISCNCGIDKNTIRQ